MTDTELDLGGIVLPDLPDEPTHRCPTCGKTFERKQQLTGHMAVHINRSDEKVACPECGLMFTAGVGIAVHRRTHGVQGTSKSATARRNQLKGENRPVGRPRKHRAVAKVTLAEPTVDSVMTGVLGYLFPDGNIPVHAMLPLIRWRDDTETMLRGIKNGTAE